MSSLSLSQDIRVLPCPTCRQTINTSMQACPYCAAPIDHAAAEASAAETSRISAACSDASYLKVMAWSVLTCFVLTFVPFLGMIGAVGLWFLRFAIPFMTIRWWVKYGGIQSPDPDLSRARGAAIGVSAVAALAVLNLLAIVGLAVMRR